MYVSHDRRRMGDGVTGYDREIRYRRLVRRVLRVRRGIVADRVEVASDGHRLVHSWHRSPRFPVHRPSGGLLESPAADHNGHAERSRRPHLHLPSGNAQHPFASNDRGRRVVRRRFQALVLSNVAKVDLFTTSLLKLFIRRLPSITNCLYARARVFLLLSFRRENSDSEEKSESMPLRFLVNGRPGNPSLAAPALQEESTSSAATTANETEADNTRPVIQRASSIPTDSGVVEVATCAEKRFDDPLAVVVIERGRTQ